QQHLALARAHRATASAEIADHPKTEYLLVEASRYGDVAHVQRRFQNSAILGRHDSTLPEKTGVRRNVPRFSRCGVDGKPGNVPSDRGFSRRKAAAVNRAQRELGPILQHDRVTALEERPQFANAVNVHDAAAVDAHETSRIERLLHVLHGLAMQIRFTG